MKKLTLQQVIDSFKSVHGDRYDYSEVEYVSKDEKVRIFCKAHGEFWQSPNNHKKGQGCPDCNKKTRYNTQKLLDELQPIWKNSSLDFSKVTYKGMKQYVTVICKEHGEFETYPERLLLGRGCFKCAAKNRADNLRKDTSWFVENAKLVHSDRYDYSNTKYTTYHALVNYNCTIHGEVFQTASKHLASQGCPICAKSSSLPETELYEFLQGIGIKASRRDRGIGGVEFDLLIPEKKIAIEYCGLYWHSTLSIDSSFTPLQKSHAAKFRHFQKYALAKSNGIRLLTIFEDEWLKSKDKVLLAIQSAVEKSTSSVSARKTKVVKVDSKVARQFFDTYHLQGAPVGGEFYGLKFNDELLAVMCFNRSSAGRSAHVDDAWDLARYAFSIRVVGGASKLFSAFVKDMRPTTVVSYSDNRWFDGGMYEKLGFVCEQELEPDYYVVSKDRKVRYRKEQFQLKHMPKWAAAFGVAYEDIATMSELEATHALGCGRIYDCGKKRWVWKSNV